MTRSAYRPLLALLLALAACATDAPTAEVALPRPQAAALTVAPDLRQGVRQATSRDPANLKASPGPTAGSQVLTVEGGFQQVTVARVHADGTVSQRCVGTPEEAEAYLDAPAPPAAPVRATE